MTNIFNTDPSLLSSLTSLQVPKMPDFTNPNLASEFTKKLVNMANEFNSNLDDNQEVGIRLVSFGETFTFRVSDIGFYDPSLIRFFGYRDDGSKIELIQHVSQISFLLMAIPKLSPEEPKREIGFING